MNHPSHRAGRTFSIALLVVAMSACSGAGDTGDLRFEVVVADDLIAQPLDGRVVLLVSPDSSPEPRFQSLRSPMAPALFGIDVEGLAAGEVAVVDNGARGWPLERVDLLPEGDYFVQAVANIYTTFNRADGTVIKAHMDQWEGQKWNRSPGNLVSDVQRVHIDPNSKAPVRITLANEIPPLDPPDDTEFVRHLRFRSDMLSEWWGTDIDLGAVVVLPAGYDEHPEARYPVVYWQGHFPTTFTGFNNERLLQDWQSGELGRFIIVLIQHPTPFYDDSYAVNSANNGPYGDALTQEFIPKIESEFRAIGEPWARMLSGGSTGGWESLAWQVFYPDLFNGTWTFCPDPVDFRHFQLVNIYEDDNAFRPNGTFKTTPLRPWRRDIDDQVTMSQMDASHLEAVLGSRGRSGDQMDIFMSVFGPMGDDGYPRLLYDKWTGEIDKGVVEYWRENYDLRHILERDWATLGPRVQGKIHIYMGDMDTYFLEEATMKLEEFLEGTTDPYYGGSFTWGERQPHCFSGMPEFEGQTSYHRVLPLMTQRLLATAPAGADVTSWRY